MSTTTPSFKRTWSVCFAVCLLLSAGSAMAQIDIGPASSPAGDPDQATFTYNFRNNNGNGTYTDYSGSWSPASGDYPDWNDVGGDDGGDGYACWQDSGSQTGNVFETEDGREVSHCDFRDPSNLFIRSAVLSWGYPINHNGGGTIFGSQAEVDDYWVVLLGDVNASWPSPLTNDPSAYKSYPSSFVYNNHGFTDAMGKVRAIMGLPGCTGEGECDDNSALLPGDDDYMTTIPNTIFNPINLARFTAVLIDEEEDGSVKVRDDNFFNENAEDVCEPWWDQAWWGRKYIITAAPDELHYSSWLRYHDMDGPFNPVYRFYFKMNFGPIINNRSAMYTVYPGGSYEGERHGRHRLQFPYSTYDYPDDHPDACTPADPNWPW